MVSKWGRAGVPQQGVTGSLRILDNGHTNRDDWHRPTPFGGPGDGVEPDLCDTRHRLPTHADTGNIRS
jgi:hypothetical protein